MDKIEFLTKLFVVFPPDTKNIGATMDFYSDALESDKNYDYKKLLKIVGKEYSFKTTPPTRWLLEKREECNIRKSPQFSGREGEIIKRKFRGQHYEFVIVPNSWGNIKTISQTDKKIKDWYDRHDECKQQELYENQEGF